MFQLTKWYFDVVDREGRSAIAYWTSVRWGALEVVWEALSVGEPGLAATHRSGLGRSVEPEWSSTTATSPAGEISFSSAALACDIRCRPWSAGYSRRLLDAGAGVIEWSCQAPAATVAFRVTDSTRRLDLTGNGYAERLILTLLPWKLPISELRWGRWSCPETRRSLVWLDWRGRQPLTLVLADGKPVEDARVEDDRIIAGSAELLLTRHATLHARTLDDVLGGLGPIINRLPTAWRALEDRKSLSVGVLGGADRGWAVHELVRFP